MKVPNKLWHKGNPYFRKDILKYGLIPKVGESYQLHWSKPKEQLKPLIFLYDKTIAEYDSTYDDDIWEIDTSKLYKECFDIDKGLTVDWVYTYSKNIPLDCIKLIYKGSGNGD